MMHYPLSTNLTWTRIREVPHVYVSKGLGGGRRFTALPSEMDARPWWRKLLALPPNPRS